MGMNHTSHDLSYAQMVDDGRVRAAVQTGRDECSAYDAASKQGRSQRGFRRTDNSVA
jgi:hypothetical protein